MTSLVPGSWVVLWSEPSSDSSGDNDNGEIGGAIGECSLTVLSSLSRVAPVALRGVDDAMQSVLKLSL